MFETRFGVGVGYPVSARAVGVHVDGGDEQPQKQHFYEPITRDELLVGAAYRL